MKPLYSEVKECIKPRVLPAINYYKSGRFSSCDTSDQLDEYNSMSFDDVPNVKYEFNKYMRSVASGSLDIDF